MRSPGRRQAEVLIGLIFLPVLWPGALAVFALEHFWRRVLKRREPEMLIGVIAYGICGLFWWIVVKLTS